MTRPWLSLLADISIAVAVLCAAWIALDILRGARQKMAIMNVVWPITAFYGGPLALWAYYAIGRLSSVHHLGASDSHAAASKKPLWQSALVGTSHCGGGCTLGDLLAESLMIVVPLTLLGSRLVAAWTLDFIFAFGFGLAFQYFAMRAMKPDLSTSSVLLMAVKADALSLIAWQVGMYGWMAIVIFAIFGHELDKTGIVFWFMMQLGMLAGLATSYPVNVWLIKRGIKEAM